MEFNLIFKAIEKIIDSYKKGGKVLICGNGSSAAQSQDMAANLINRYKINRKPIECLDLTSNLPMITSIANDFGFEKIFERQIEAYAKKGDVLIGLSTSGNSENIINAVKKARDLDCFTICLLGKDGGKLKDLCDLSIIVQSDESSKIQEKHLSIIHLISEKIEEEFS